MCLCHSKLCWQNKELFYTKPGEIQQRRDIGIMFIGELLVTSEYGTLHFLDSGLFMDGRNKEKRIGKLKINRIVSQLMIYLSD